MYEQSRTKNFFQGVLNIFFNLVLMDQKNQSKIIVRMR